MPLPDRISGFSAIGNLNLSRKRWIAGDRSGPALAAARAGPPIALELARAKDAYRAVYAGSRERIVLTRSRIDAIRLNADAF